MDGRTAKLLFHGLFEWDAASGGAARLRIPATAPGAPRTVPCPETGLPLRVASLEISEHGVCPACDRSGAGGYVSFVSDLRLAFACPGCRELVWIAGA